MVGDGKEALATLKHRSFDLILMDVQMPEMNGFEAAMAIRDRENETGGHIPIIAMTAHAMKGDRERCLVAGMDHYVTKPILARKLFEAIESLAPVVARAAVDASPVTPTLETDCVLDADQVLDRVDGDVALLRELVTMFLEDCPRLLGEIEAALGRRDAEALARAAHTLKGAIGNFDSGTAFEAALRLETLGREGDLSGLDADWATLRDAVARFQPALTALAGQIGEA